MGPFPPASLPPGYCACPFAAHLVPPVEIVQKYGTDRTKNYNQTTKTRKVHNTPISLRAAQPDDSSSWVLPWIALSHDVQNHQKFLILFRCFPSAIGAPCQRACLLLSLLLIVILQTLSLFIVSGTQKIMHPYFLGQQKGLSSPIDAERPSEGGREEMDW